MKSLHESMTEISELKPGPMRHSELPQALIERIRELEATFDEVYPATHEEWLDTFKRDVNPEFEIVIWEDIGWAYTQFLKSDNIAADARKEAFGLLLLRSASSEVDVLLSDLQHLTEDQARRLLALYEAVPRLIIRPPGLLCEIIQRLRRLLPAIYYAGLPASIRSRGLAPLVPMVYSTDPRQRDDLGRARRPSRDPSPIGCVFA